MFAHTRDTPDKSVCYTNTNLGGSPTTTNLSRFVSRQAGECVAAAEKCDPEHQGYLKTVFLDSKSLRLSLNVFSGNLLIKKPLSQTTMIL